MTTITKDPELRDRLISSSITFMQTVTEVYGPEKGMELWGTIAETVDDNLRGDVFLALLTGNYAQDKVRIKNPHLGPLGNKIALIKCLRTYDKRNLGLKEAKDMADRMETGSTEVSEVKPEIRPTYIVELRKLGMVV